MLITAICSLFFNLVQMKILHQGDVHYHLGEPCDGRGHSHGHDHGHHHHHHHGEGGCDDGHSDHHDHDHFERHSEGEKAVSNINVDAAFLHALSDMILTIGVIIASIVIYFRPEWQIADPICTFVFSFLVCFTVIPILRKCFVILMEGAPENINLEELWQAIQNVDPDMEINELHVWSISQGKNAFNAHLVTKNGTQNILKKVTDICKGDPYNIGYVNI